MRKKTFLLLAPFLLLAAYAAPTATPPASLEFPLGGFSIRPYESAPGAASTVALTMSQPASNGFASNVNVIIQPYAKPMSDFIVLSKAQFIQHGATVIAEKAPNANEWACEYQAAMNGKIAHFYARAVSANDHVYLATGSATVEQWPDVADKIKASVDSLQAKGKAPGPVPSLLK